MNSAFEKEKVLHRIEIYYTIGRCVNAAVSMASMAVPSKSSGTTIPHTRGRVKPAFPKKSIVVNIIGYLQPFTEYHIPYYRPACVSEHVDGSRKSMVQ